MVCGRLAIYISLCARRRHLLCDDMLPLKPVAAHSQLRLVQIAQSGHAHALQDSDCNGSTPCAHLCAILRWCIAVVNHGLDEALAQLGAVVVDVCAHCTGVCCSCLHTTCAQPAHNSATRNSKNSCVGNLTDHSSRCNALSCCSTAGHFLVPQSFVQLPGSSNSCRS